MWAIYLRTSTDRQSSGLLSQEKAVASYCANSGVNIRDCRIFTDEGISGGVRSRPALDELMLEARAGKLERVIVFSFSRFARNTKHLLNALDEFEKLGVDFVSVSESIDTSTSMGKVIFTILAALSQMEREIYSQRIKAGLDRVRSEGRTLGRKRVVNYELVKELLSKKTYTYEQIARLASCSKATVARINGQFFKNREKVVY